jgi:DNA (cytosine-5)-methyltransferase 1
MTERPRLLDLFCCAGGAAVGYQRAGFDVFGLDIDPQPNYPLPFLRADVMTLDPDFIASFDVIHASPPCQSYSDLAKRNRNADQWPRLIEPVREMLRASGRLYVIENVEGAPIMDPVVLCGTMFASLRVIRHRLFESNIELSAPAHKRHPLVFTHDKRKSHYGTLDQDVSFVQVTGGGNCSIANARDAMGIDWMNKAELNEAIPPAYTEHLGKQIMRFLVVESADTGSSVAS